MHTESQYNAWMLELANYFIKNHEYQVITVTDSQKEMWLVNSKEKDNPIMVITSETLSNVDYELIDKHRKSLAAVFSVPAQGLNISVKQETGNTDDTNVVVGPSYISNSSLLTKYNNLDEVLKTSKNPDKSFKKAVGGLRRNLVRTQKKARRRMLPVTTAITALIILVFIVTRILVAQGIQLEVVAVMLGAYYKRFIVDANEYWRLLTSGFLHVDFFHILMNMIALRNLGTLMERVMGSKKFLFTLLVGIIFGNVFVFVLDEATIGLGISGGLFALMGALIVYLYETGAFKNRRMLSQMINIILINVLISLLPGVSFAAHLGGFQAGIFLGFIFSKRKDWDFVRKASLGILSVMSVVLVFLMVQNAYAEPYLQLDQQVVKGWLDVGFDSYARSLAGKLF